MIAAIAERQAGEREMSMPEWPLSSQLGPLGALDTAPRVARSYTKLVLAEWNLNEFTETAVLIISELVTNSVRAGSTPAGRPVYDDSGHLPVVHIALRSDRVRLLVEVRDQIPVVLGTPVAKETDEYDESGRGLSIVESMSERWGYQSVSGWAGKRTWSLLRIQPLFTASSFGGSGNPSQRSNTEWPPEVTDAEKA
jgi:hypothetical protein